MGPFLLLTVQVDIDDELAGSLETDLMAEIVKRRSDGVLMDISGLDVVDSFIGRMIGTIAASSRLLGAETVVVGIRPAVAITLVELGVSLRGVHTALNIERGMEFLRELTSPAAASRVDGG